MPCRYTSSLRLFRCIPCLFVDCLSVLAFRPRRGKKTGERVHCLKQMNGGPHEMPLGEADKHGWLSPLVQGGNKIGCYQSRTRPDRWHLREQSSWEVQTVIFGQGGREQSISFISHHWPVLPTGITPCPHSLSFPESHRVSLSARSSLTEWHAWTCSNNHVD